MTGSEFVRKVFTKIDEDYKLLEQDNVELVENSGHKKCFFCEAKTKFGLNLKNNIIPDTFNDYHLTLANVPGEMCFLCENCVYWLTMYIKIDSAKRVKRPTSLIGSYIITENKVYTIRKPLHPAFEQISKKDFFYLLLEGVKPPFVAVLAEGNSGHLFWKTRVNYSNDLFFITVLGSLVGKETILIERQFLQEVFEQGKELLRLAKKDKDLKNKKIYFSSLFNYNYSYLPESFFEKILKLREDLPVEYLNLFSNNLFKGWIEKDL